MNDKVIEMMQLLLNIKDYTTYLLLSKTLYKKGKLKRKIVLTLIKGNISEVTRLKYWITQCSIVKIKVNSKHNFQYYVNKDCPYSSDISRDLDRTFPKEHVFYDRPENKQRLDRILKTLAVKNPDIGYIQGLNFIAGNLLLQFNDETAFWILE